MTLSVDVKNFPLSLFNYNFQMLLVLIYRCIHSQFQRCLLKLYGSLRRIRKICFIHLYASRNQAQVQQLNVFAIKPYVEHILTHSNLHNRHY